MTVEFVEVHDDVVDPLGVKGVGEIGQVGVAAAIANAVFHATGRRVRELPMAPELVMDPPAAAAMTIARGPVASCPSGRRSPAPDAATATLPRQPRLGLVGLLLVVPIAGVLAVGAGGAEGSVLVLGPLVTYSLPLVAMVAFWWEDWPGTRLRPSWSGWADTALIAVGAVVLTGIGQVVVGRVRPARHLRPVTRAGPRRRRSRPRCRWPAPRSWRCCS